MTILYFIRDGANLSLRDGAIVSFIFGCLSSILSKHISLKNYLIAILLYEIFIYFVYGITEKEYHIENRIIYNIFYLTGYILFIKGATESTIFNDKKLYLVL